MMFKRWMVAAAGIAVVAAIAIGVAFALASSGGDGDGEKDAARSHEGGGDEGDGLAICIQGAVDCDDTIEDPDEPVSSGPITIIDDQDPNQCNFVHNIDACERRATEIAVADLAQRLAIEADAVTVVSAEFVQWPDSCLGVEKPGLVCAQVIMSGFRIILRAQASDFEYHTDAGTAAVLVE